MDGTIEAEAERVQLYRNNLINKEWCMVMGEEEGRKEAEPAVGKDVVKETVA